MEGSTTTGILIKCYLVHCYDCKLSVLTFVQRTFGPERWREGSALHGPANAMICDCNKLTKTGESINMFVDA